VIALKNLRIQTRVICLNRYTALLVFTMADRSVSQTLRDPVKILLGTIPFDLTHSFSGAIIRRRSEHILPHSEHEHMIVELGKSPL